MTMPPLDSNQFRREIILVCNVSADVPTFFASIRLVLDRHIDFDGSSWFTVDPATVLPTGHIANRWIPDEDPLRYPMHEATVVDDVDRFVTLTANRPHVSILQETCRGDPSGSARYRAFLKPNKLEHELRTAFVNNGRCWGGFSICRGAGPGFTNPEMKALSGVVEFLGEGMRRAILTSVLNREPDDKLAPGVIVLGPASRIDLISPPAESWLTGLGVELGDAWSTVLPSEVYAVAGHARRTGAGHFDMGPAVATTRTADGGEVELHATLMESEPQGPAMVMVLPPQEDRIARPVTDAYGLSAAEEVALRRSLRGGQAPDSDADADGLASALEKLGAESSSDAPRKVYADHYAARLAANTPIGPDGWFADQAADQAE